MTILYTQIINAHSKRILSGSYSRAGISLSDDNELLSELKTAVLSIPLKNSGSQSKVYNLNSKTNKRMFYFRHEGSNIYAAIASSHSNIEIIGRFLEEVARNYIFGDDNATHYEFDDTLKSISNDFNRKMSLATGQHELSETHSVLVENLDTLINRGENINNLKELADSLNIETKEMSRKVHKMKMDAKMEQYKIYAVVGFIILLILYFLLR